MFYLFTQQIGVEIWDYEYKDNEIRHNLKNEWEKPFKLVRLFYKSDRIN